MSRVTLSITAADPPLAADRLRIVRAGVQWQPAVHYPASRPPAEFVQACAPCGSCGGTRITHGDRMEWHEFPCPDCRIELVGPCPTCEGQQGRSFKWDDDLDIRHEDWVDCAQCSATGTVTLGYAYVIGLPDPQSDGTWALELEVERPSAIGMRRFGRQVPVVCPDCLSVDLKSGDAGPSPADLRAIRAALAVLHNAGGPNYLSVMLDLPDTAIAWVLA